jgi:hypothetical protein
MLLFLSLLLTNPAHASYQAERDPPVPEVKKQYRLILHTPERKCADWRKATPQLGKNDMIVSATKKDEEGGGCRFLWIVTPTEPVGPTHFELEPFGAKNETFDFAAPAGYQAPRSDTAVNPVTMSIPGVANENGNGPANQPIKGHVGIPGIGIDSVPTK